MGKLTAASRETVELPAVAFTPKQIQKGLESWTKDLIKAKAAGDIFAAETATTWINTWLDRKNAA